jgi:uncharacterized cupin superfamily protein
LLCVQTQRVAASVAADVGKSQHGSASIALTLERRGDEQIAEVQLVVHAIQEDLEPAGCLGVIPGPVVQTGLAFDQDAEFVLAGVQVTDGEPVSWRDCGEQPLRKWGQRVDPDSEAHIRCIGARVTRHDTWTWAVGSLRSGHAQPVRSVRIDKLTFAWDPADPDGFRTGQARLGGELGARRTGATVYELPPGQAVCPYHYEYGEEEWLLVLDGAVSVRTPDGVEQLQPHDMAFFPTGPAGAHQVRNDSATTARVVMWSEVVHPTATAYPDSGKVGVYTGDPGEDVIVERANAVDYYRGETDPLA